jgi:hypothetical protein
VTNRCFALVLAICPLTCVAADSLIPTTEGTGWNYDMVQERGDRGDLDLTEPNMKDRFTVTYRIGGTQKVDNKDLLKLELYRDATLVSTDLIAVEEHGIVCSARIDEKGALIKLIPPQKMLAAPLKTGTSWNFDGQIGQTKVNQHYKITGEEDVAVAAGKFHTWRIHCDQTAPASATIDRWFVPGTGFVKVVTAIKTSAGGLLQQTSLELKELPKIAAAPLQKAAPESGKLSVGVSKDPTGDFTTSFSSETPAIYARWTGRGLPPRANIRAVWIAENVADVAADYEADEGSTVAPTPDSHGTFTLSRPKGGWAPGDYRVEFYVDDALAGTVKVKIAK